MKKNIYFVILCTIFSISLFAQKTEKEIVDIDSEIQGDLYIGNTDDKTLIIIIAGSGATDRNGNQPPILINNSLKLLAEGLADSSLNVFTFDKRVISQAKNKVDEKNMLFDSEIDDVSMIIEKFKNRFEKFILIGHSQGSLTGMIAAEKNKAIAFISIAGGGQTIDHILSKQIEEKASFLKTRTDEILSELKKGNTVEKIIPMLEPIFRPSVQPYLISWIKYDPSIEINKLKIPVLIIQGDKDIQVEINQAEILHSSNDTSELKVIKGMNHVLKNIEKDEDNNKSYSNGRLPLHPELLPTIINFINKL